MPLVNFPTTLSPAELGTSSSYHYMRSMQGQIVPVHRLLLHESVDYLNPLCGTIWICQEEENHLRMTLASSVPCCARRARRRTRRPGRPRTTLICRKHS